CPLALHADRQRASRATGFGRRRRTGGRCRSYARIRARDALGWAHRATELAAGRVVSHGDRVLSLCRLFRKVTTLLLFGCSVLPGSSRFSGMKSMADLKPLYQSKIQSRAAIGNRFINRNRKTKI